MKNYKKLLVALFLGVALVVTLGINNYTNATTVTNIRVQVALGGTPDRTQHRGEASGTLVRYGGGIRAHVTLHGGQVRSAATYTTAQWLGAPVSSQTPWQTGLGFTSTPGFTTR